jgi:ankyrin repeat protein
MADDLLSLIRLVIAGKTAEARRALQATPSLATTAAQEGATRGAPRPFFFASIGHYLYQGDTALHMAAAAHQRDMVELLMAHGADVHAKNRMGAQPLHYAADGNRNPNAQADTIRVLVAAGADPNAVCKRGVAPLHRAVRTRSSAAVRALLAAGANPRKKNGNGSTPQQLAKWTTGKSGSGSARARHEQAEIIRVLRQATAGDPTYTS